MTGPQQHGASVEQSPRRARWGPAGTAVFVLGLALATSATSLAGLPESVGAASSKSGNDAVAGWLEPVVGWFDPIVRWLDLIEGTATGAGGDVGAPSIERTHDEEPAVRIIRLEPRPRPGAFSMNLYAKGDFVHQQTVYWCVAAAAQTMMNIIDEGKPNRSGAYQKRLHFQGRRLDQDEDHFWRRLAGESRWRQGLHGLGLTDWAGMLSVNGYGPYEVDRARTRKQAVRMAARAIRMTGRPVGLIVWRGAHSWVMSGFTATADPAHTDDYVVKTVFIQDPWYPFVSSIWGASRPPNAAVPVDALAEDYLRYNRPGRRNPMRDGKFMLILPTLPPDTQAR